MGRVPLELGYNVERPSDGTESTFASAWTGWFGARNRYRTRYRGDWIQSGYGTIEFLNPAIRSKLKCVNGTPVLSSSFESSVPGLYFVGIAAANSFGPVMRFAFGAGFAAKRLTSTVAKSLERSTASVRATSAATIAE